MLSSGTLYAITITGISAIAGSFGYFMRFLTERPKTLAEAEETRTNLLLEQIRTLTERVQLLEQRIDDDRARYEQALEGLRSENAQLQAELQQHKLMCKACDYAREGDTKP